MNVPRYLPALLVLFTSCSKRPVADGARPALSGSALPPSAVLLARPGTLAAGPPWGGVWCITPEEVWSADLTAKHFPPGGHVSFASGTSCSFQAVTTLADRKVGVLVSCGEAYVGKLPSYTWPPFAKAQPDRELGMLLTTETFTQPTPTTSLEGFDPDVPCSIGVDISGWPTTDETERRARALMKDIAARLTPESIARPRAELVINQENLSEAALRAELARWPAKVKAVSRYAPLSPGYPKLIRSEDYPGLPAGKHFLLFAVCRSSRGRQLAVALAAALLPTAESSKQDFTVGFRSVDGLGLPEDCPAAVDDFPGTRYVDSAAWTLADKRHVTMGYIETAHVITPGEVRGRFGIFLYSREGNVLDSIDIEFLIPKRTAGSGPYASESHVTYSDCKLAVDASSAVPAAYFGCVADWDDEVCRVNPHYTWTYSIEATPTNKIHVTTTGQRNPGNLCRPNVAEEPE